MVGLGVPGSCNPFLVLQLNPIGMEITFDAVIKMVEPSGGFKYFYFHPHLSIVFV